MASDRVVLTARDAGLIACTSCARVVRARDGASCRYCGAPLYSRRPESLQRVWAWLLTGILAYIPAHLYPLMIRSSFGDVSRDTITSGLWALLEHGSYLVAVVVFAASVVIPITKFVVIAALAWSLRRRSQPSPATGHRAFEFIELIGRWSMIDVFVVTVLAGLVQIEALATIEPGLGATFFGLSVICTMMAAMSFDTRLLWDRGGQASIGV